MKKCHNCKGKGMVDGGASKKKLPVKFIGKCDKCKGKGVLMTDDDL